MHTGQIKDLRFPYIISHKNKTTTRLTAEGTKVTKGDIIYSSRKGVVSAIPDTSVTLEGISLEHLSNP